MGVLFGYVPYAFFLRVVLLSVFCWFFGLTILGLFKEIKSCIALFWASARVSSVSLPAESNALLLHLKEAGSILVIWDFTRLDENRKFILLQGAPEIWPGRDGWSVE